jgi:hypothetical protein
MDDKTVDQTMKFLTNLYLEKEDYTPDDRWRFTLGGGEPTLHPRFWEAMTFAFSVFPSDLDSGDPATVAVVTNGTVTATALRLAAMAKNGYIHASLSRDDMHPKHMVAPEVVAAFTRERLEGTWGSYAGPKNDGREIRNSSVWVPIGRAKTTGVGHSSRKNDCICGALFIRPNGNLYFCGCPKSPKVGNVWDGITDYYRWVFSLPNAYGDDLTCYRDIPDAIEEAESNGNTWRT